MTNHQRKNGSRHNQLCQGLTVSLTFVSVLLVCFYLYQYDNQYTKHGQQPSDGVLDLRQAHLDDHSSPYHLQKNWEFYPGALLTPDDDFSLYPHKLCSLRESSKDRREKQGTLRLTILFPDTPMSYALKLPTTFSSYKFFLNQDLIQSMGYPDIKDEGEELFNDQILYFWASGEVQILLQYSDDMDLYSGLSGPSAPPILGRPLAVYTLAEYHKFFLAASEILILVTLLLSVTLYFWSRQGSNLAMIVLCVNAMLYLAYPLFRSTIMIPVSFWYQMGMLFYFGCHAATHWAYSLYFGWKDRVACFINWCSTVTAGLCAVLLLVSSYLPDEQSGHLFYGGIRLLQWGSILCGIALTLHIVMSGVPNKLMGAASVTLWAFMLIDLICPDFSPVIFARLPEMSIICFMDISILVEYMDVASAHQFRILYAQKIAHAEQLLKMEERHYTQLSDQVEDARRIRHDLRQHLRVIRSLLDQGDDEALSIYLEQYVKTVQPLLTEPMSFFQNPIVDALLAYYWSAANKRGADFDVKGQLQELPESVYVDFCSTMGNLLENALEALDRQAPNEAKWISVRCEIFQKKLMMEVKNSNSAPVRQKEGYFQSAKRDELGTGTLSVSIIAQQYGGFASFSQEENCFTAQVLLPLSGIGGKESSGSAPHRLKTDENHKLGAV